MDTPYHPDRCGPGYRYPTRVRDLAFQLWAFKCSRRLTCVADELASVRLTERWDCVPGERTLRHWVTKGDWPAATANALSTIAPDLMQGLVTDLLMGAAEGMTYLRAVVAGRVTQPNSARIRAILTALSLIGVPDVAHATIQDAMREHDSERCKPVSVTGRATSEPESLAAVKARIAAGLGIGSQHMPGDHHRQAPEDRSAEANGSDRCSA